MTQTVGREIASEGHRLLTDWGQIDWKKVRRVVQSLRFRIFRATQQQDWRKVRNLTRLLPR